MNSKMAPEIVTSLHISTPLLPPISNISATKLAVMLPIIQLVEINTKVQDFFGGQTSR